MLGLFLWEVNIHPTYGPIIPHPDISLREVKIRTHTSARLAWLLCSVLSFESMNPPMCISWGRCNPISTYVYIGIIISNPKTEHWWLWQQRWILKSTIQSDYYSKQSFRWHQASGRQSHEVRKQGHWCQWGLALGRSWQYRGTGNCLERWACSIYILSLPYAVE